MLIHLLICILVISLFSETVKHTKMPKYCCYITFIIKQLQYCSIIVICMDVVSKIKNKTQDFFEKRQNEL